MESFEERAREEELVALAKIIYAVKDRKGFQALENASNAFFLAEKFFEFLDMRQKTKKFEKESDQ